jgi:cytochrome c-type biogenesis protein CcmE
MKLVIGMVVVALALGFFIFATFVNQKSNAILYYYTVGEALASPARIGDSAVRIGGRVVDGTIVRDPVGRRVDFTMADDKLKNRQIKVAFHSSITPDTFKDGSEVLVEGKFRTDGTFDANNLFAKCPSKYQSKGYPRTGNARPMPSS